MLLELFKNHKFSFHQNSKKMRFTILLAILGCLFIGLQQAEACPLCTTSNACDTSVYSPDFIGILGTAQGRVWVICCDTPIKVIVKKGDVKVGEKTMKKSDKPWDLNEDFTSGITYKVEAYHVNNNDRVEIKFVEVKRDQ